MLKKLNSNKKRLDAPENKNVELVAKNLLERCMRQAFPSKILSNRFQMQVLTKNIEQVCHLIIENRLEVFLSRLQKSLDVT